MYHFQTALQLFSVRDNMEDAFFDTLKAVGNMGYEGVEFAGLFGHSAEEVREMCAEAGVIPVAAHVPFQDMTEDPALLDVYRDIGCRYVVIPYLTEEYRPGQPGFAKVIQGAKLLGERAGALGMKLCYHNHDFEFVKIDGQYALDVLYEKVPAELLSTEIDTCWVKVGGENPADYLRKYTGRVEIVHLKDFTGRKCEHMYELIGLETEKEQETSGAFEFRPLGQGVQDFPAILSAARDAGAQWVVVEQDNPSMGKTPLECAQMSIDYLKSLH